MSTLELRREIKKVVDHFPAERLEALADYVAFLKQPNLKQRLTAANKDIAEGKGVAWRRVRSDV